MKLPPQTAAVLRPGGDGPLCRRSQLRISPLDVRGDGLFGHPNEEGRVSRVYCGVGYHWSYCGKSKGTYECCEDGTDCKKSGGVYQCV
jgi:hypothetical protein